jgi:hypothetical protein
VVLCVSPVSLFLLWDLNQSFRLPLVEEKVDFAALLIYIITLSLPFALVATASAVGYTGETCSFQRSRASKVQIILISGYLIFTSNCNGKITDVSDRNVLNC